MASESPIQEKEEDARLSREGSGGELKNEENDLGVYPVHSSSSSSANGSLSALRDELIL